MSLRLRGGWCVSFIASSGDADYFETVLFKSFLHFDSSNVTDLTPRWLPCPRHGHFQRLYEGWNFNSGNYLFTTDTK